MEYINGANLDTRSDSEKEKDFRQEELVAKTDYVLWEEKHGSKWRTFDVQNQANSGSCVAQTIKKMARVLALEKKYDLFFSATDIYQKRSNKPTSGMIGLEAFEIWRKEGIALEQMAKSQLMSDAEMDRLKIEKQARDVGEVFKIGGHLGIQNGNFESVASTIQATNKAVMVWFFFTAKEWSDFIPTVQDRSLYADIALRHSVTAVDFFLYNGIKYLLIEDSSHFGGHKQHLISEDFYKTRNWFTRYTMNFKFDESVIVKPKHTFENDLEFSAIFKTIDEVVLLQDFLKSQGFFPVNTTSTGYFGAITKVGVQKFQEKWGIAKKGDAGFGRFGPKTREKANSLIK